MSDQNLPHKPSYLSSTEWEYILNRDLRHCSRFRECSRTGQTSFCSEHIDIDHSQPSELGGDDSVGNVRLLCSGYNRGRPCEPLEKWLEMNYWDRHEQFVVGQLREIQRLVGWDAISDVENQIDIPGYFRRVLLGSITLLPGATGIGKSLLMQAALFRVNKLIGMNFPRVKSVLWLTNDTTLRDTAAIEIETEAFEVLKMIDRPPLVHRARSFDDLLRGPMGADVTVSTVQSLWERQNDDGPMRSDSERLAALNQFDTFIFDECDWGDGQVHSISQLGRHALQFALTASPLTFDTTADRERAEDFIKRFVLIGPEAIADYDRALKFDACLKLLEPATVGPKHTGFDFLKRGQVHTENNNKMPRDHALYRGLILQAVVETDNLETRMKALHPDHYYSPHIMVRMDSIQELLAMKTDLETHLANLSAEGTLVNEGWEVSVIFMGRQMAKMPPDERDLSRRRGDQWVHPFMRAKNNNGRAVRGSKRILLMCNIGLRGINNWPVSTIVDCTVNESIGTIIQFAWGRPLRLPKHLSRWTGDEATDDEREFITVKVWLPEVDGFESKRDAVERARSFIMNMLPLIRDAGFLTWSDLIEGRSPSDADLVIDPTNRPLTQGEKFAIQGAMAQATELGAVKEADIDEIVGPLFADAGSRLRKRSTEYAGKLLDPEFRDRETLNTRLEKEIVLNPENVMNRLRPQDVYDPEDLMRWVRHDPRYKGYTDAYIARINQKDEIVIHAVSDALRKMQIANYRPPARTYRLHGTRNDPGVMIEIAGELKQHLDMARQLPENIGEVNRAVIGAAKTLFDISDASEGGPMDHPAYHIAMLCKHRRRLQTMARGRLISEGLLGQALKRFATNGHSNENTNSEQGV
jgi:hypothetical protein